MSLRLRTLQCPRTAKLWQEYLTGNVYAQEVLAASTLDVHRRAVFTVAPVASSDPHDTTLLFPAVGQRASSNIFTTMHGGSIMSLLTTVPALHALHAAKDRVAAGGGKLPRVTTLAADTQFMKALPEGTEFVVRSQLHISDDSAHAMALVDLLPMADTADPAPFADRALFGDAGVLGDHTLGDLDVAVDVSTRYTPYAKGSHTVNIEFNVDVSFTPWELSTLKISFHRWDRGRKGYLDAADMRALGRALGLPPDRLTEESVRAGLERIDTNGDGQVSFEELVAFLATTEASDHDALRLRAAMLDANGSIAAGAAMSLMAKLKGKAFIALGTMFYDPIRLFRDQYVTYCSALRAVAPHGVSMPNASLAEIFVHSVRTGAGLLRSVTWVAFAVGLDCAVGVSMFLTYAALRQGLQARCLSLREICADQLGVVAAISSDVASAAASAGGPPPAALIDDLDGDPGLGLSEPAGAVIAAAAITTSALARRLRRWERSDDADFAAQAAIEAAAGFGAGVVSGVLEPLAQAASRSGGSLTRTVEGFPARWASPRRGVLRSGASHSSFFLFFFLARHAVSSAVFDRMQCRHTSVHDALVTCGSGCLAGAAYRGVAYPWEQVRRFQHANAKARTWDRMPPWVRWRIAWGGFGTSLATTMPVTGVAFLAYELAILYL